MFTEEQKASAELEILDNERIVDYDTKEYPVETIVQKYLEGIEEDENEIFVPDYQREHTWDEVRQSKFIESVLIGLPIPFIFVADINESKGRLEIVDGSQRIRTLAAFIQGNLELTGLKKLPKLNGFKFADLPLSRQRRFKRRSLRMIELTEKADEEVRRDIFERINTGSDMLKDMERRFGVSDGPLLAFVKECAQFPKFRTLAPLSAALEKRKEREEYVLRFFAYLDNYQGFKREVRVFLDEFIERVEPVFDATKKQSMLKEFNDMLNFVEKHFPNGFRKGPTDTRAFRIRFEAIATGVALALRENPALVPKSLNWLDSKKFKTHTTSDASNVRNKIIRRIEFVRDNLLA